MLLLATDDANKLNTKGVRKKLSHARRIITVYSGEPTFNAEADFNSFFSHNGACVQFVINHLHPTAGSHANSLLRKPTSSVKNYSTCKGRHVCILSTNFLSLPSSPNISILMAS